MDRQIQRLEEHVSEYVGKTPMQIRGIIGAANTDSMKDRWYYDLKDNWMVNTKMILIFKEEKVTDLILQDFFLGIKINENSYSGSKLWQKK